MRLITILLCMMFLLAPVLSAGETVTEVRSLSDEEIGKVLDGFFAMQRKLKHAKSVIYTYKAGGDIFSGETVTVSVLEAQMPNRLVLIDMGDPAKKLPPAKHLTLLLDGNFLWEISPADDSGVHTVEQHSMKQTTANGRMLDLATILVGQAIATTKELREIFIVTGKVVKRADGSTSYKFHLTERTPKDPKKPIDKADTIDLYMVPGKLPWRIDMKRYKPVATEADIFGDGDGGGETTYQLVTETRELKNTQTNLDNPPLKPYVPATFWFGRWYNDKTASRYKVLNGKGEPIAQPVLQQFLMRQIQQRMRAARPAPASTPTSTGQPVPSRKSTGTP